MQAMRGRHGQLRSADRTRVRRRGDLILDAQACHSLSVLQHKANDGLADSGAGKVIGMADITVK